MNNSIGRMIQQFDASAPLHQAHTIPGNWYTEPAIAEMERRSVFSRVNGEVGCYGGPLSDGVRACRPWHASSCSGAPRAW
jgi:hypothetical protein